MKWPGVLRLNGFASILLACGTLAIGWRLNPYRSSLTMERSCTGTITAPSVQRVLRYVGAELSGGSVVTSKQCTNITTLTDLYCSGLSLSEIGAHCGISESSVRDFLSRNRIPSEGTMAKSLCTALNVSEYSGMLHPYLEQASLFDDFEDILNPVLIDASARVENREQEPVFSAVKDFVLSRISGPGSLVVSISGGVDSMVLSQCLLMLAHSHNLELSLVHIDYGLREVSAREAAFVRAWAAKFNVALKVRQLDGQQALSADGKKAFDKQSRLARYEAYREAMAESQASAVLVGHHRDDVIENMLDNLVDGRNLLNVQLMAPQAVTEKVPVWRPLGSVGKKQIRQFAVRYCIPHLLDLEDPGARRILWRGHVLPAITQHLGDESLANIARVGQQSKEWNDMIDKLILEPFYASASFFAFGAVVPIGTHMDSPGAFWQEALAEIFHRLNASCLRKGALDEVVAFIRSRKSRLLTVHKIFNVYVDSAGERLIVLSDQLRINPNKDLIAAKKKLALLDQWPIKYRCGAWDVELTRHISLPNEHNATDTPASMPGLSALLSGHVECLLSGLRFGCGPDQIPFELANHLPFQLLKYNTMMPRDCTWSFRAHADVTMPTSAKRTAVSE